MSSKIEQQAQLKLIMDSMNGNYARLNAKLNSKYPVLLAAVVSNWPLEIGTFMEKCYWFMNNISPYCENGNRKRFLYFNKGYISCRQNCKCAVYKKKNTMLERHGVEHPLQKKEFMEKASSSREQRYGSRELHMINKEQRIITNKERYNSNTPLESKEIQDKIKDTVFKKTGYYNNFANPTIQQKIRNDWSIKNTNGQRSYILTEDQIKNKRDNYGKINFQGEYNKLYEPKLLTELLQEKSRNEIAQIFNCSTSLIDKQIDVLELTDFQNTLSYYETLITQLLRSHNVLFIKNTRKIIAPKELDFYIPDLKFAIEFCGLRWHGEEMNRGKTYHFEKYQKCKAHGIHLIQIFQDEWDNNSKIIKNIILGRLNIYDCVIYARNTICKKITMQVANKFLIENHLQGVGNGTKYHYGLFFNDALVSVMAFTINNTHEEPIYELKRFASFGGLRIVGGASKLYKAFVQEINPTTVISYCDLRYFTGKVYEIMGFKYLATSNPGYWYTKGINRYHRRQFTKKKLTVLEFDAKLTEREIMKSRKYDIIWDCGHTKYIWRKK